MKHMPLVYPLVFALVVLLTFFTGAYALAEGAVTGQSPTPAASSTGEGGRAEAGLQSPASGLEWYESAAILVCPLH